MAKAARLTALAAVAVLVAAAPAAARGRGIHVSFAPRHALQGTDARIAVSVRPAGAACTLRLRYHDGSYQQGLARVVAQGGQASWTWSVPTTVQAGQALATVRCGRATVTRKLVIVGRLVAPKIVVQQTGFSIRPGPGAGSRLSYGLMLHDASPSTDATKITVQTNFVLADDHLLGTDTRTVPAIGAGDDYALGNTVSFPGAAPVVRLEVVVQTGGFARHSLHLPTLANIHLVPNQFNPSWLGTVEGELQNTDPALILQMSTVSGVVFDASGNILGGSNGFAMGILPPGAREFLKFGNGLDVIPMEKASQVKVSVSPTWQQASG